MTKSTGVDADQIDVLGAREYLPFDEARANDVAACDVGRRDRMRAVADGMSLSASVADGDGGIA